MPLLNKLLPPPSPASKYSSLCAYNEELASPRVYLEGLNVTG